MPQRQVSYQDVQIGDALGPQELFLSKEQVRAYARTTGMWVPRFTDDEGARKEGLPGMITPGNMSFSLLAGKLQLPHRVAIRTDVGAGYFEILVVADADTRPRFGQAHQLLAANKSP